MTLGDIPSENKPTPLPKVLTGIRKDHQVSFLSGTITLEAELSFCVEVAERDSSYLRGTTLVSEINFNPSRDSRSVVVLVDEHDSSGSEGS
jgi:hypothetical protein